MEVVGNQHEIMRVFADVAIPSRVVAVVVDGENGGLAVGAADRDSVALPPDAEIHSLVEKLAGSFARPVQLFPVQWIELQQRAAHHGVDQHVVLIFVMLRPFGIVRRRYKRQSIQVGRQIRHVFNAVRIAQDVC